MSEPKQIILEKHYNENGVYLGMTVIYDEDLTPEFIAAIKADDLDTMGWRKYWGVLDNKAREKWRAAPAP